MLLCPRRVYMYRRRLTYSRFSLSFIGSGVTACIVQAAAELAGYGKLRVYDGSWSEYAAQKDAVIIKA